MINKKNIPLYIALAVPVLMILLVAAFIYLPGIGSSPKQNFVYETGSGNYYGWQSYVVSNGHIVANPPAFANGIPGAATSTPQPQPNFFLYDVAKNQAQEITFAQAQSYQLDSSNTSSDGYTIEQGSGSGGGLLFGGTSDYTDWFIKGYNRSRKLNLKLDGPEVYNNFEFLGWIE